MLLLTVAAISTFAVVVVAQKEPRIFVDDLGVEHRIAETKPRILTHAHEALALRHFGR